MKKLKKYVTANNGKVYTSDEVLSWNWMKQIANLDPRWYKARSKLSKALWQDPDYRAKTIANRWPTL